jgi:antitoxin component HigA of HigAB toxin-antitoxin module
MPVDHVPENRRIHPASYAAMLRFLHDQKGLTQTEAAAGSGRSESRISEVLNEKRRLTRAQMEGVAKYFRVSPAVFSVHPPTQD